MELSIWDGISDMNEKRPLLAEKGGVYKHEKSTTFIYKFYTQEDICLLDQTERISAFISQRMNSLCWMTLKNIANRTTSIVLDGSSNIWRKHWPKTKDNLHLDDMKTYRISGVHAEMLKTLARKLRMKEEEVIEEMIQERFNQKKWHE
jgi:hypothetical protein